MNRRTGPWAILGIAPTRDAAEIRRAYAKRLKVTNPEDDPEGFKELRAAYELLLRQSKLPQDEAVFAQSAAIAVAAAAVAATPPDSSADAGAIARIPSVPDDPAALWLDGAISRLAIMLRHRGKLDFEKARTLQKSIFESPHLERFDLFQRAETQLSELLARHIPVSDDLLKDACERFEWAQRQLERSTQASARTIVARLGDLWFLRHLTTTDTEEARAYGRLHDAPRPARRFCDAYLRHHDPYPELQLIEKLEREHPALLANLSAENVAWWRSFAQRPRYSMITLVVGGVLSFIGALILISHQASPANARANLGTAVLASVLGAAGACLFKLYVIDRPIELVNRRWYGRAPRWFQMGWLPVSCGLVLIAGLIAPLAWLAWPVAALSWLVALWSVLAAGRARRVIVDMEIHLKNSLIVRIAIVNAFVGIWLIFTVNALPGVFGVPLLLTIAGALCASAGGRHAAILAFASYFSNAQQRHICGAACLIAIVLGSLMAAFGAQTAWQPPLVAATIAITLPRRAIPFEISSIHPYLIGFAWLIGLMVLNVFTDWVDRSASTATSGDIDALFNGAFALLAGVLIAVVRWASRQRE